MTSHLVIDFRGRNTVLKFHVDWFGIFAQASHMRDW